MVGRRAEDSMRLWLVGMVVAGGMATAGGLLVARATILHVARAMRVGWGAGDARR